MARELVWRAHHYYFSVEEVIAILVARRHHLEANCYWQVEDVCLMGFVFHCRQILLVMSLKSCFAGCFQSQVGMLWLVFGALELDLRLPHYRLVRPGCALLGKVVPTGLAIDYLTRWYWSMIHQLRYCLQKRAEVILVHFRCLYFPPHFLRSDWSAVDLLLFVPIFLVEEEVCRWGRGSSYCGACFGKMYCPHQKSRDYRNLQQQNLARGEPNQSQPRIEVSGREMRQQLYESGFVTGWSQEY